jgi:hypothetical protein
MYVYIITFLNLSLTIRGTLYPFKSFVMVVIMKLNKLSANLASL